MTAHTDLIARLRAYPTRDGVEAADALEAQDTLIAALQAQMYADRRQALVWRDQVAALTEELQKRDKCSYMGPMRDCPTHGESKDAARYRWLKRQPWVKTKGIHAWGALLDDAIDEARHDAPDETPNALAQADAACGVSPGAMGCASNGTTEEE